MSSRQGLLSKELVVASVCRTLQSCCHSGKCRCLQGQNSGHQVSSSRGANVIQEGTVDILKAHGLPFTGSGRNHHLTSSYCRIPASRHYLFTAEEA